MQQMLLPGGVPQLDLLPQTLQMLQLPLLWQRTRSHLRARAMLLVTGRLAWPDRARHLQGHARLPQTCLPALLHLLAGPPEPGPRRSHRDNASVVEWSATVATCWRLTRPSAGNAGRDDQAPRLGQAKRRDGSVVEQAVRQLLGPCHSSASGRSRLLALRRIVAILCLWTICRPCRMDTGLAEAARLLGAQWLQPLSPCLVRTWASTRRPGLWSASSKRHTRLWCAMA
mmetsp:Transcript_134216/g.233207  ORF Transcript_134216/g.233207 Transcript_134216/m.233207 type:complete len:228 (-) Transcript_134216:260-943(-)